MEGAEGGGIGMGDSTRRRSRSNTSVTVGCRNGSVSMLPVQCNTPGM